MPSPRKSKIFTFSMPPEMAEQVHQVVRKESRTVSEFLREAIRLYMDGRRRRSLPLSPRPGSPASTSWQYGKYRFTGRDAYGFSA